MLKRSVVIQGHATSVRLEAEFWRVIDAYCQRHNITLSRLIVDLEKLQTSKSNLASRLRVFCLDQVNALPAYDATPELPQ